MKLLTQDAEKLKNSISKDLTSKSYVFILLEIIFVVVENGFLGPKVYCLRDTVTKDKAGKLFATFWCQK